MKKQRTRDEGLALARAYHRSGMRLGEFSKKHGVTECSVQYWRNELRKSGEAETSGIEAQLVEVKTSSVSEGAFEMSAECGGARVRVGAAEIVFTSLPHASWLCEFVVSVNRYL